jgi:sporulation protein YlmC with PRC-barrel domain
MLIFYSDIKRMPVMSLQTGTKLGAAHTPIIDPSTLTIVAFFIDGAKLESNGSVILMSNDIREVGKMGFIIDSIDDLTTLEDIIRIQKIADLNFDIVGLSVIDEQKNKLGKVINYTLDPLTFTIHQLQLKPPILKSLQTTGGQISRQQIIEINNSHIIVRSSTNKEFAKERITSGQFVNPFRTPQPKSQSDTTNS